MNFSDSLKQVLVVGSDCLLGKVLMMRLKKAGRQVLGTTRRRELVSENNHYLDLAQNLENWHCPRNVSVAVLCAGVSKLEYCRKHPEPSFQVNVENVSVLAKKFAASGVFVIYPSTSHVFDGTLPWRKSNDPLSPVTEYGRQKAQAEQHILASRDSAAIVRMTKIIGPDMPLFSNWSDSLKKGRTIHPLSDMGFSPVPLSCVASILQIIIDLCLPGVFQISGERDISYEEAASIGARIFGVNSKLVQPVTVSESATFHEPPPAHTTLDMDFLKSSLGVVPPKVVWTMESLFARNKCT